MKTLYPVIVLSAITLAANAETTTGGFNGPDGRKLVTVKNAVELPDDTPIKLNGRITRKVGDETYEFTDESGTLTVEIDDEDWRGVEVSATDQVEITGEVDREWRSVELEVDTIRRLP